MLGPVGPALKTLLLKEASIGAMVGGVLMWPVGWLVFGSMPTIPLWGMDGAAFDLLPSTLLPSALMTVVLTFVIRKRRLDGEFEALEPIKAGYLPVWLARRALFVRAPVLALTAVLLLAPLALLFVGLIGLTQFSLQQFLIFKSVYGAINAALLSPVIVLAALQETAKK